MHFSHFMNPFELLKNDFDSFNDTRTRLQHGMINGWNINANAVGWTILVGAGTHNDFPSIYYWPRKIAPRQRRRLQQQQWPNWMCCCALRRWCGKCITWNANAYFVTLYNMLTLSVVHHMKTFVGRNFWFGHGRRTAPAMRMTSGKLWLLAVVRTIQYKRSRVNYWSYSICKIVHSPPAENNCQNGVSNNKKYRVIQIYVTKMHTGMSKIMFLINVSTKYRHAACQWALSTLVILCMLLISGKIIFYHRILLEK